MFDQVKDLKYFFYKKKYEKFIFLLPITLILGNLGINLNIFLIIFFFN